MIQQGVFRSGLSISEKQAIAITKVLEKTVEVIPARFVLLIDISGQVIGAVGEHQHLNLLAISSLAVGDLAASQEIAHLTGEYEDEQIVLREGKSSRMLMAEAGRQMVLLAQVSNDIPMGWARVVLLQFTKKIAEVAAPQDGEDEVVRQNMQHPLDIEDEDLSEMLESALDDIWMD